MKEQFFNGRFFSIFLHLTIRYSNLNLNQSFKIPILIPVQSLSKLDNNKNDDSTVNDKNGEKGYLQSWNKSSNLSLNALKINDGGRTEMPENFWNKNDSSFSTKNSTLSLHITAHESLDASDSFIDKSNDGGKLNSIKNAKQISADSIFISNPFEFPRQQNDKMPEPEVSKFTASQQLLNPNAASNNDKQHIIKALQPQQKPPPPPPSQPSAAVLQRHQFNPIRNYDTYEYQLQSCAAFNKHLISQRRRPYPFFDQQIGIAQRPNTDYVRDISDRCPTQNSGEVYRYTAQKWKANSKVSFDSVEFKYILGTDPTLKAAVDHLMSPEQSSIPLPTIVLNDTSLTPKFTSVRKNSERVEVEDFEQDDGERDHTDEEDWGEKKPKRKRNAPYKAQSGKRGSGIANLAPDGKDPRQHVCQECGARYKSRPGLVYHRKHAHENL
uniref:C2H2-type domain-containing protein n=1 Tax=Panagrolaimus sp. PS1159 TaxID=55785 RepID=A0AC35ETV7_9BILA